MTTSHSSATSDARGLELARHSRRLLVAIVLVTFILPLCFISSVIWSLDKSEEGWVALPLLVSLGYLLLLSILILDVRLRAKKAKWASEAMPDAYLICEATDPRVPPIMARPLIVHSAGVILCNPRGAKLRPVWELQWADIAAADVSEFTYKLDTRPAVRITCKDGRTKYLLLSDKKRRSDALMEFPRRVATLLDEHAVR